MTGVSGNNRNTPPHWDIALLGLWWSCNYGAVLTSFSLHCVLSRQGYRVLLLDHAPMTMASHVNDPGSVFRTFFREEGIESIPISSRRDAERTNRLADTFIAGSDQLWNYKYTHNQDMQYYLDFVDGEKRKIAYATSLGDSGSASTGLPGPHTALFGLFSRHFRAGRRFRTDTAGKIPHIRHASC